MCGGGGVTHRARRSQIVQAFAGLSDPRISKLALKLRSKIAVDQKVIRDTRGPALSTTLSPGRPLYVVGLYTDKSSHTCMLIYKQIYTHIDHTLFL